MWVNLNQLIRNRLRVVQSLLPHRCVELLDCVRNKCARESGFDRKNFVRKLVRDIPVKRNSYNEFVRRLQGYMSSS